MKRIISIILCAVMLLMISCGCSISDAANKESTRTVKDMKGNEIAVPANITSYAIHWVGATDIVAIFDGFKGLMAYPETSAGFQYLTKMYPHVKECTVLPKEDISAEELLSCGAEVIFVRYSDNQEVYDHLSKAGVCIVDVEFTDYETMMDAVDVVANVFGTEAALDKAAKFRTYVQDTMDEVTALTATLSREEKPTILTVRDADTLRAYGPGRYAGRWVDYTGATSCLVLDNPNGYVNLTAEQLLEYDPDFVVFALENQAKLFCENEAYQQLDCVKNGTVYNSPAVLNSWSNQGAESVLQLKWGLSILHADLADNDMKQITKDFYVQFYDYEFTEEEISIILGVQ